MAAGHVMVGFDWLGTSVCFEIMTHQGTER
jgi:hypothetical protein